MCAIFGFMSPSLKKEQVLPYFEKTKSRGPDDTLSHLGKRQRDVTISIRAPLSSSGVLRRPHAASVRSFRFHRRSSGFSPQPQDQE